MIAPRICPECQTSNPPQAAFCFGCGKPLKQVSVTPEQLHQRYHLLHKLGTGGFGAVYQAEDTQLGKRLVAIKEMSSQSNLSTHACVGYALMPIFPCLPIIPCDTLIKVKYLQNMG